MEQLAVDRRCSRAWLLLVALCALAAPLAHAGSRIAGVVTLDPADIAPSGIALDAAGNVYLADRHEIKKLDALTGWVTSLGPGLVNPVAVGFDAAGNMVVWDTGHAFGPGTIRQWNASTSEVTTVLSYRSLPVSAMAVDRAGNVYFSQLDGPALPGQLPTVNINQWNAATRQVTTLMQLSEFPSSLAADPAGNLYLRAAGGLLQWNASTQQLRYMDSAISSYARGPLAVDGSGNVYVAFPRMSLGSGPLEGPGIKKWNAATRDTTTVLSGVDGIRSLVADDAGGLYIVRNNPGQEQWTLEKWSPSASQTATVLSSQPHSAMGLAADASGNIYFSRFQSSVPVVVKWSPAAHQMTTLIGSGLERPGSLTVDGAGNVYVVDGDAIKKWSASSGSLMTLVSSGLAQPNAVAVDRDGNLYIADRDGATSVVRKWNADAATLTTLIAGLSITPSGLAVDSSGNVYVPDRSAGAILKWDASTQQAARVNIHGLGHPLSPTTVTVDAGGTLYFTDDVRGSIVQWNPATERFSEFPVRMDGLAVDGAGNVYAHGSTIFKVVLDYGRRRAAR